MFGIVCRVGLVVGIGGHVPMAAGQSPLPGSPPGAAVSGPAYRFYEEYTTDYKPMAEDAIGQCRVAYRETRTSTTETDRSAPESSNLTVQVIYRERPAEVGITDHRRVTAVVRGYDSVRIEPLPEALPSDRKLLEGLEIWFQPGVGKPPEVFNLKPGREMTDPEFNYVALQVFVPDLGHALPDLPTTVGATYPLSPGGMAALVSGAAFQGELTGTLQQVKDDPAGGQVAVLDITGKGAINLGPTIGPGAMALHAQIQFAFKPAGAPAPGPAARSPFPGNAGAVVNAPGKIVRLSLTQQITSAAGQNGRLRRQSRRELVLERRPDDPGAELVVPATAPTSTPENSWLTYVDPHDRFHVQHPQRFIPQPVIDPETGQPDPNAVELLDHAFSASDVVQLVLQPRDQLEPESIRRNIEAQWSADRLVVKPGESGWLPEADWPGMKVYRLEATLIHPGIQGGAGSPAGWRRRPGDLSPQLHRPDDPDQRPVRRGQQRGNAARGVPRPGRADHQDLPVRSPDGRRRHRGGPRARNHDPRGSSPRRPVRAHSPDELDPATSARTERGARARA